MTLEMSKLRSLTALIISSVCRATRSLMRGVNAPHGLRRGVDPSRRVGVIELRRVADEGRGEEEAIGGGAEFESVDTRP